MASFYDIGTPADYLATSLALAQRGRGDRGSTRRSAGARAGVAHPPASFGRFCGTMWTVGRMMRTDRVRRGRRCPRSAGARSMDPRDRVVRRPRAAGRAGDRTATCCCRGSPCAPAAERSTDHDLNAHPAAVPVPDAVSAYLARTRRWRSGRPASCPLTGDASDRRYFRRDRSRRLDVRSWRSTPAPFDYDTLPFVNVARPAPAGAAARSRRSSTTPTTSACCGCRTWAT